MKLSPRLRSVVGGPVRISNVDGDTSHYKPGQVLCPTCGQFRNRLAGGRVRGHRDRSGWDCPGGFVEPTA